MQPNSNNNSGVQSSPPSAPPAPKFVRGQFYEVELVMVIAPGDARYRKPDIGHLCVKTVALVLRWEDVSPMCFQDPDMPERWTVIGTRLGCHTINVPYKQVVAILHEVHHSKHEGSVP